MDTDSFIMHIKTKDIYEDITDDAEKKYAIERPLPIDKNKKLIKLMKDKLGGKIMTELVELRPNTCFYLIDNGSGDKKAKGTKKCVIKGILKYKDLSAVQ